LLNFCFFIYSNKFKEVVGDVLTASIMRGGEPTKSNGEERESKRDREVDGSRVACLNERIRAPTAPIHCTLRSALYVQFPFAALSARD